MTRAAGTGTSDGRIRSAVLAGLASALLAACGGGGDAGPGTATTLGIGTDAVAVRAGTTGFVPAAGAAGEVLHADATLLRPLRDEALWVYRGTRAAGSARLVYASFRQTVASADGYTERVSSPLEGASGVQRLSVSAGTVFVRDPLQWPGEVSVDSVVELRSPVRRGDQVTLVDRSGVALREDLDGDRQVDRLDIASYSRVVGDEDVELPELGRMLRALRVDVTTVSRVQRSSRAQPDAASTVVVSQWYAPGIGLVRRSATAPSSLGIGPVDTDERLQYWDGIDRGIGLVPSAAVAGSGTNGLGPWLEAPWAAVRSGDRAFVLTPRSGGLQRADLGVVLSVLDRRGRVVASVDHADLGLQRGERPSIMPLGDGVGMALRTPGVYADPFQLENLRLVRFDAQGYRTGSQWLVDGALPGTLKAAADGLGVWATWVEHGLAPGSVRVMAQAFDAQGRARTKPQVLDGRSGGPLPDATAIDAAGGRALVTWRVPGPAGDEFRQALVPAAGPASVATLDSAPAGAANGLPVPRVSPSLAALTWTAPLQRGSGIDAIAPRGVILDATAQPRRSVAGSVDHESLPQLPAHDPQRSAMQADADALLWTAAGTARLRAEEVAEDRYLDFAALLPASGPLATASARVHRYRDRSPAAADDSGTVEATQIVAFDDRWLILGHDGWRMTAAVLHRP